MLYFGFFGIPCKVFVWKIPKSFFFGGTNSFCEKALTPCYLRTGRLPEDTVLFWLGSQKWIDNVLQHVCLRRYASFKH